VGVEVIEAHEISGALVIADRNNEREREIER
jgi:hypothetical protein